MTPTFTILLPHKLNGGNNAALRQCVECLAANTRYDFALLMHAAEFHVLYQTMNEMALEAATDCCIFLHSDMFVAPGWDEQMVAPFEIDMFRTGLVVEPGAIGVFAGSIERDFGRRPESFRRADFEAWCEATDVQPHGEGWFAPFMFSRKRFLDLGGFDLASAPSSEWSALDQDLFAKHKATGGRVVQARSFVYHLQRFSEPSEQSKRGDS